MATITVPSESPKKQVVVGGTPQTSFTFDFVIFDTSTDLKVYNGDTLLTVSTHYTVSGNAGTDGGFDGGTVTLVNTLASGVSNTTVTILRNISTDRLANLASTGPLDIDAVNKDFNRYVSMLQQFEETVDRSVQAPEQDPTSVNMTLPVKATRLGKMLSFNSSSGDPETTLSVSDVSGAITSASNAAASATAAASSASSASASATTATTKASEASASATAAAASAASAAVTIATQSKAEAGTDNGDLMTPLRTKQAVDSYGVITADDVATSGANKILKLDGSGALPAISGANLTNLPIPSGGGTVTATASGAITTGKTVILNANGTVSEVAASSVSAALSASTYTQSGETTAESNGMDYDTTDDLFIWAGKNTISGSNTGRAYALSMNSSLVISEAAPPVLINGSPIGTWSVKYCPAMQRTLMHNQNSSAYVTLNTLNVVSGAMKASNQLVWYSGNRPYGTTNCLDADELILGFGTTTSPTGPRIRFAQASLGSDASGDTFSGVTSDIDVGEGDMTSQTHTYYHQSVHFTSSNKWLLGAYKYSSYGYGLGYSVGYIGGSAGSRTFTSQSAGTIPSSGSYSDPPHSFMGAGDIRYDATKDRAFVFDSEHLYSLSVGSDGILKQSSLVEIQSNHQDGHAKKVISIPNSDHLVCFFNDQNNSNRFSYRVVKFTPGVDATGDIFVLEGSNVEITTQVALSYTPVAYSPDVDGFLAKPYVSSVAQPFIGVRVGRQVTNIKATGTTERFLGVAKSTVSDGQSVEIAVAGAVVTMAAGGMTIGDTQFVQNDGSVGTTDAGYGTAGIAVSATQVLME